MKAFCEVHNKQLLDVLITHYIDFSTYNELLFHTYFNVDNNYTCPIS